jgi:hypothetical protein
MKQKVKKLTAVRRLTLVNLSQSVKLYGGNAVPSADPQCQQTLTTSMDVNLSGDPACNATTVTITTGVAVDSMPQVCNSVTATY